MFRYWLYITGTMGVLFLMGVQYIDASETPKITTTSSSKTADGVVVTETNVQAGAPVGRIQQITDGVRTSLNNGYNTLNQYSGGRLDTVKTSAINGYQGALTRVSSLRNRPPTAVSPNADPKSTVACALPQKTEKVVVETQNTTP